MTGLRRATGSSDGEAAPTAPAVVADFGRRAGRQSMSHLPVSPPSRLLLVDHVVEQLRTLILSGQIPPGTRLIQEDVSAMLSVSRTPLREAMRVLVHDGLLRPAQGSSVEVVELSGREAYELYQVREVVDGLAARLCAERGLRTEVERQLGECCAEMQVDPFDPERFHPAHVRFHTVLLEASGNRRLRQQLNVVQLTAQMVMPKMTPTLERTRETVAEHPQILDAVRSGDGAEAERVARDHIRAATTHWITNGYFPDPTSEA